MQDKVRYLVKFLLKREDKESAVLSSKTNIFSRNFHRICILNSGNSLKSKNLESFENFSISPIFGHFDHNLIGKSTPGLGF